MFKCFKKSFIKRYFFSLVKKQIIKTIYLFNIFIPKDNKSILAFVDYEMINGELVPYKSDNVYLLCEYIKKQRDDLEIIYISSNQFGGKTNNLLNMNKKLYYFVKAVRAKVLLFKQPPHTSEYFTKKQYIISLGYFIPFKADYWDFKKWEIFYSDIFQSNFDMKVCSQYREKILGHFTYNLAQFTNTNLTMVTASKYASEIIAKSHNLPIDAFKVLGSPKSDRIEPSNITIFDIFSIPNVNQTVVLYTPTFRDIFMKQSINNATELQKSIFGYMNEQEALEEFLIKNNIIIVVKLHKSFPYYRELETLHIKADKSYFKNCYFLDFELEAKYNLSIYQLFEYSDAMIADYSSISFDYLPYNKPIIYNIPDIEEYRDYRGFSYEPIEDMMAGEKVKTVDEFKKALLNLSKHKDNFEEKRKILLGMVNEVPEGKALSNIYEYLVGIID